MVHGLMNRIKKECKENRYIDSTLKERHKTDTKDPRTF